jgi:hypothetical protein
MEFFAADPYEISVPTDCFVPTESRILQIFLFASDFPRSSIVSSFLVYTFLQILTFLQIFLIFSDFSSLFCIVCLHLPDLLNFEKFSLEELSKFKFTSIQSKSLLLPTK